ncbi:MAG: amino acid adenylation domain-containing protein [Burkholderiales bacterium]|nr:amino acid adenylation domain-containing protein [Burkholderiales bacterium]
MTIVDAYGDGLHRTFFDAAAAHPERTAVEVGTEWLSYAELRSRSLQVAHSLVATGGLAKPRVGVLASRSTSMYAGILGVLAGSGAVVPLNPGFPQERTRQMIELAGAQALVADAAGLAVLEPLLAGIERALVVVVDDADQAAALAVRLPRHRFVATSAGIGETTGFSPLAASPDDLAYLFFTSGSTGTPKGVGVLHRNVVRFVQMSQERYRALGIGDAGRQDRFSQFYDITFDSSMFDLFVGWSLGACLCCPTLPEWINPNKYIEKRALTVIDIVPSTGHMMDRGNGWRAGRFPLLRLARFGGEALSADLAAKLALAAPNAAIDNVYGPTECTVDASYYRWDRKRSPAEALHGVVPIGTAGPRVTLRVVDADLVDVPVGGEGELLIAGPQVTPGYWKDAERTAKSFIRLPGSDQVHYRTGDLVRRAPEGAPIPYLGRMDYQIKIAGVRIELGEIEQAMRSASGSDEVVAVGWPPTTSGASGVVGFVARPKVEMTELRARLKEMLPGVMVPKELRVLDRLPLNVNGKVDRKALLEDLRAGVPA